MKRVVLLLVALFTAICVTIAQESSERNCIFVLDCTKSMMGYNNAPNIWEKTKLYLNDAITKELIANPTSRIVIIPFQDKVLPPIFVDPNNVNWASIESELDLHVNNVTATNICDAWLAAESQIDKGRSNYFYLLTDGNDNIGGYKNASARIKLLADILRKFCGKYAKTKGFYVELTPDAQLPESIRQVIASCNDITIVGPDQGPADMVGFQTNIIEAETRELPAEYIIESNNSGVFSLMVVGEENDFVDISIVNNEMKGGRAKIRVASKPIFGNSLTKLNDAIGHDCLQIQFEVKSGDESKNIHNPEICLNLYTSPIRVLHLDNCNSSSSKDRVKSFLWVKGNKFDTLSWNLMPQFNEAAVNDRAFANFKLASDLPDKSIKLLYNGDVIEDSIISINPKQESVLSVIVPANVLDNVLDMKLVYLDSQNLDRINHFETKGNDIRFYLSGELKSHYPIIAYIFWGLLGLILLLCILWFVIIRNIKYPRFKAGIIQVTSPNFANIRVKGYRKVVFTPVPMKQSVVNLVLTGKIRYHIDPAWICMAEVTPSAKNRMRFVCPSGKLLSVPAIWQKGMAYQIIDKNNQSTKIEIKLN